MRQLHSEITMIRVVAILSCGALACVAFCVPASAVAAGQKPHFSHQRTTAATSGPLDSNDFWLATPEGALYSFGNAGFFGSPAVPLNASIVDVTPTRGDKGYWMTGSDGGVFSYGDASFFGSTGNLQLQKPIVALLPTTDGKGYWLIASDGGVFSFGDAKFFGSTGGIALNQPIVSMTATPDGKGYWLVASDGGIFSFGDASFYGSTGAVRLVQPIVSMTTTPDGKGYWLVASDGGIFTFGDALFFGSASGASIEPTSRVVDTTSGAGYWIVEQNGTSYAYGDATGETLPIQGLVFRPITQGDKAVDFAFDQLGKPYIYGGNGPVGYDCSGLALASWKHADGVSFARVSNDQYHTAGISVGMTDLAAGDLVFWGTKQTAWTTVYHTGIFVGGGQIVESTGDHVQLNSLYQWGSDDLMANGRRP